ncbi:hypothetical protein LPJ61_006748, partial [Coemansia biformis]
LTVGRAAAPSRGFAISTSSRLEPTRTVWEPMAGAAKKAKPSAKATAAGRGKPAKAAESKKAPSKTGAKAKKAPAKKAPARKAATKKAPTKKELLEGRPKLNSKKALLTAPTRPPNSYALFVKSTAPPAGITQSSNIAERSRAYAEQWKQLGDAQKHRLENEVHKLRAEYEDTLRKWWSTADPELVALENQRRRRQRGSKAILLKDPFAPKRPLSAYVAFAKAHVDRNKGAAGSNGIGAMSALMKEAGAQWKRMAEADKAPF